MKNYEIAQILYEIADFLEIEGIAFKPYIYQKAALALETLSDSIEEIYKKKGEKGIEAIPGVGKSIAQKIIEYLKTGKIKYHQQYKRKYPFNIRELTQVEGLGPKMARDLYKYLGIKNLRDLEKKAREGKIKKLPNFGEKTEKNILEGIAFLKKNKGRFLLGEILPSVLEIQQKLENLKEVEKVSICGSVRRMKETIGDVDFLVVAKDPEKVMNFFCSLEEVVKILEKGKTRSSVRMKKGFDIDLRIVSQESYGSALQYFTGNKEHNIKLRKIALAEGFKLNEYGLFQGTKMIAGKSEKEIYEILGMEYPPPELRENRGEIEAAREKKLPTLVELKDIKGDLHCHSSWNGGKNSIEEIAREAQARGYQYIGIADHTKFLKIEHGLDEQKLAQQRNEIDTLNVKFKVQNLKFKILQGCEANILNDGSIDVQKNTLKKLDYIIAGIHSNFKMSKEKMTQRMIKAMKNPYVKIISHPTGRILKKRDEYQIDIEKILKVARETGTILEINSFPERLDLNEINIKRAIELGVILVINSDAHQLSQLRYIEYGLAQARRGWAEKKDILNTRSLKNLLKFFKK